MNPSEASRRQTAMPVERPRDAERHRARDPWSLLSVVNAMLRARAAVLGTALLLAAAVAGVTLLRPRSSSASASFTAQGRVGAAGLSNLAAQFGLAVPNGDAQGPQFYVDLLQTRQILHDVVDTAYILPTDGGRTQGTIADFFGVSEPSPELRRESAIDRLRRQIATSVSPKTGVVTFTVTTTDPLVSRQVADRLLTLLNRFNLQTRQSQAAAERRFTQQRLDEAARELRLAESRLLAFLQRNRQFANSPE